MCDLSICPRSLATFPHGSLSRLAGVGCAGPFWGPLASRSAGSLLGPRSEGLRGWLSISGRGHLGHAAPLSAYFRCGWRHVLNVSTASAPSFRRFEVCGGPAHLASAWRGHHVRWTVSERTGILCFWLLQISRICPHCWLWFLPGFCTRPSGLVLGRILWCMVVWNFGCLAAQACQSWRH